MTKYKELLRYPDFLKVRARARALMGNGTDLIAILYKDRKLIFKTASGTYGKKVTWTQTIELTDASIENILAAKKFRDLETLIRESGLKIHCNCPAFHWWGFKYIAWRKGYGLEREMHRPMIRNPHEVASVCKHLYLVLSLYPFWAPALAKRFKNWAESKEGASNEGINSFHSPRMNKNNRDYVANLTNPNMGTTQTSQVTSSPQPAAQVSTQPNI